MRQSFGFGAAADSSAARALCLGALLSEKQMCHQEINSAPAPTLGRACGEGRLDTRGFRDFWNLNQ